jgi:WD40 repeat protein
MAFSPDGRRLAVFNEAGTILDAATGRTLVRLAAAGAITAVAFSPDGRHLATAYILPGQESRVILRDADTGQPVLTVGGMGQANALAYSPDGRRLATAGFARQVSGRSVSTVKMWDTATGQELLTVPTAVVRTVTGLAFSPDGHKLVVAGRDAGHNPVVEVLDGTPR